jgi:hypothetical protein
VCIVIGLLNLETACKEDRTTVVFGKVVDQNQEPVDSIMIIATGSRSIPERLNHTFTDNNGEYTLIVDVPRRYHALNAFIPYLAENPKYEAQYQTAKVFKNGQRTTSCCFAEIGDKTRWDFELAPK